jgi:hypothetical protein
MMKVKICPSCEGFLQRCYRCGGTGFIPVAGEPYKRQSYLLWFIACVIVASALAAVILLTP